MNGSSDAPIVALDGVSKRYSRRGGWVLREVGLTVDAGTVHQVVGGNGDGKSTLLRILAGASAPTRGQVRRAHRAVSYVPERLPVDLRMSAERYLGHMARLRGLDAGAARTASKALLDRLALTPGVHVPIRSLSKGNRQKVCLASAFPFPSGLTVLDEPFSGLDETAAEQVGLIVQEVRERGGSVVLSAHSAETDVPADLVHHLAEGRLRTAHAPVTRAVALTRLALRPPSADALGLLGRAGVQSVDHDANLAIVLTTDPDSTLRCALAEGWSFVRGEPAVVDRNRP